MKKSEHEKPVEAASAAKSIFVIKARESNALRFEIFLKNRGWEITATSDLKKALAVLLTQPIQCVLISVDHPSPKCMRLPGIIAKTINVPVILFSESTNQSGINSLRASGHPYILFPPVSGPAIERMILKIEKDQQIMAENASIHVDGKGGVAPGINNQNRGNYKMEDVVRLFEGEGQSAMLSAEEGEIFASNKKETQEGADFSGQSQQSQNENPSGGSYRPQQNGSGWDPLGGPNLNEFKSSGTPDHKILTPRAIEKAAIESKFRTKKHRESDSILVMGVEHALTSSTMVSGGAEDQQVFRISKCSRVHCFDIQSEAFTGYVIVACGSQHQVQEDFSDVLKDHLRGYLEQNGIETSLGDATELKLKEVSFEDWSMQEATFLRKSIHHDSEIAISFFPLDKKPPAVELSAEAHMCKIGLEEIRSDTPLEFDMYLYFPLNSRYVLYAGKDGMIGENRHGRLVTKGVTDIHLRRDAEKDLSRYRVQNFLNDLIQNFNEKDKVKGKKSA